MTCREFEHSAASLALRELTQMQDDQLLSHAGSCRKCAAWLEQQQALATTMQMLQAQTAGCEAGSELEQKLLQAFRQTHQQPMQAEAARRWTPIAFRLSRFFEVGAYVAVAAAIVVGLFLGIRLLEDRSTKSSAQNQSSPATAPPSQAAQVAGDVAPKDVAPPSHKALATSAKRELALRSVVRKNDAQPLSAANDVSPANGDPGYVALMLCDPLSCSNDVQVVRLELPPSTAAIDRDAQPVIADVVVGNDGVVRAMRIVN